MELMYKSTRNAEHTVTATEAILKGLADDGGLFMPESIPTFASGELEELVSLPYAERAARILSKFLTDYTYEELLADCNAAYCDDSFPGGAALSGAIGGSDRVWRLINKGLLQFGSRPFY